MTQKKNQKNKEKKEVNEKMARSTKAGEEPVSYAKVGMFLHENAGKATTKVYTSINEGLKVDAAEKTRKVGEVTVEMHVKEDRSVKDNQIYQKDIWAEQKNSMGDPSNDGNNTSLTGDSPVDPSQGLTPLQVLKNFVDRINDRVTKHDGYLIALAAVSAVALVVGVATAIKLFF